MVKELPTIATILAAIKMGSRPTVRVRIKNKMLEYNTERVKLVNHPNCLLESQTVSCQQLSQQKTSIVPVLPAKRVHKSSSARW